MLAQESYKVAKDTANKVKLKNQLAKEGISLPNNSK